MLHLLCFIQEENFPFLYAKEKGTYHSVIFTLRGKNEFIENDRLQLYGEYEEDVRNGLFYAFVPFEKMKKEHPDKRFRVIQVQKEQQDMHWSKVENGDIFRQR